MCHCFRVMSVQKAIIQSGIKEVIYDCDKYADTPSVMASETDGWMQPESGIISIIDQTGRLK